MAIQQRRQRLQLCGYECELVHPQPSYLQTQCAICQLVLRSPHLTSCCGHNFCKDCIGFVQKSGKLCPLCGKSGFTLTYNREKDSSVQELEVYCAHCTVGCEWRGKLALLDKHLNVDPESGRILEGCAFVEVPCSFRGCRKSFQRHQIMNHQRKECPQRPFSCEYCQSYCATYYDVITNHWPICKRYPILCPNRCADGMIERQHVDEHLSLTCPLQIVRCEFDFTGCETKLPRQEMPNHMSNSKEMVHHMSLLAQQNQRLSQQNQELTKQVAKLSLQLGVTTPLPITMTNFEQRRLNRESWYSEGFYTHARGYKICLMVNASGRRDGEGTHISCFIYLMPGKYDNDLTWPFQGDITITLLNQREERNHHAKTVTFSRELGEVYTGRVTSGERAASGWGYFRFIRHSVLGQDATRNCQYLMNDCLCFLVEARFQHV